MSGRHAEGAGRLDQVRDVTEMMDDEFEDESLDSDEAFDDEDEEQFGGVLNTIASRQKKARKNSRGSDGGGDDVDSEDASDGDDVDDEWNDESGAGGVLLSDLLKNSSKEDAAKQAQEELQRRKLVGMIVKEKSTVKERTENTTESEFNVAAKGASLSLSDLMGHMESDGKGALLKSQLQKLSTGREKSIVEPIAPVVAARMDRRVAYEEQSEEVGRNFQASVQRHRSMATVSFRGAPKKEGRTIASMASIDPQTKLEMEVAKLLSAAGSSDTRDVADAEAAELEKLPDNETTMEAVKERQKQLQKMRHLIFYDEMKKKRTAKIKSKLYRKIRKKHKESLEAKQRQRLRELDPEMAKKMDEKDALERARLRVSLKHRTTSKWMKKNLKRQGGGTAKSRQALQSELKEREKLHNKIMSRPKGNLEESGRGSDSDNGDSDSDTGDDTSRLRNKVGLITEVESDKNADGETNGIMGMKFMQRSLQRRREVALQDAKELLQELDGTEKTVENSEQSAENAPETGARRKFGGGSNADSSPSKRSASTDKSEATKKMRAQLRNGQQTASVEMGAGTTTSVSGAINTTVVPATKTESENIAEIDIFDAPDASWNNEHKASKSANAQTSSTPSMEGNDVTEVATDTENPWLTGTHTRRKRTSRGSNGNNRGSHDDTVESDEVDAVAKVVTRLSEKHQSRQEHADQGDDDQSEIVARAFANAGGFNEAFELEKQRETEEALPKEEKELAGPSKRKLAAQAAKKKEHAKKKRKIIAARADAKLPTVVINEKRDKKAAKYKVTSVPYPFKSREQYERSLKRALGQEWNTLNTMKKSTRPEVLTRAGVVIQPLEKQRRRKQNKRKGKF